MDYEVNPAIINLMAEAARDVPSYRDRMAGYQRVLEARSAETIPERLRGLAGDPIRPVRLWVARNPRTPPDALDRLLHDSDSSVQWNALLHLATPGTALERLANDEAAKYGSRTFHHRSLVAHHPNASTELRHRLAQQGACRCPDWCAGQVLERINSRR
ncbi:hypothetical protein I0C86_26215 [Plantactinospora sp. S1510]|uniref:HEAT repeat domain-containing protein n=1 Tax=Plantactinospora alkalitolerans TaxID=2789879 RepID=A0ABS0H2Q6_9ACTN|nr:hypothetical protein [Plantactinospora alkalitolerans]MBF9132417.1 hypothetical protein [Plantactinospora alkalitolerans]